MGTELGGKSVSLVAQLSNSLTSLASKAANIREEAVKTVESLTGYPIAIPPELPSREPSSGLLPNLEHTITNIHSDLNLIEKALRELAI